MKNSLSSIALLSQGLRKYIRGLVHQECDVDDILHDIYLKMSDSKHAIEYPQRYAKRVAKNIVLDMHKHQFNQHEEMVQEPQCEKSDLDEIMDQQQRIQFYQGIVADMPSIRRNVFIRYRLRGESKQVIADELGLSQASVDKHITRALAHLKLEMEKRQSDKEFV